MARNEKLVIHQLEVTSSESVERFYDALNGQTIDVLINNAGIMGGDYQSIDDMDYSAWSEAFEVIAMAKGQKSRIGKTLDPEDLAGPKISQNDFRYVGVKAAQMAKPFSGAQDAAFVAEVGEQLQDALATGRVLYEVVRTSVDKDEVVKQAVEVRYDLGGVQVSVD